MRSTLRPRFTTAALVLLPAGGRPGGMSGAIAGTSGNRRCSCTKRNEDSHSFSLRSHSSP